MGYLMTEFVFVVCFSEIRHFNFLMHLLSYFRIIAKDYVENIFSSFFTLYQLLLLNFDNYRATEPKSGEVPHAR